MNYPISYYVPNDVKSKCDEEMKLGVTSQKKCEYLERIIEKVYESKLFTDLSFDYKNYIFLKDIDYIEKFVLNTWHIPDEEIILINDKNFRLIIPFNDSVNYN